MSSDCREKNLIVFYAIDGLSLVAVAISRSIYFRRSITKGIKKMIVSMKNDAGMIRQVKVGFSWTAFFFGGLPFFFRGIPVYGFLWILLAVCTVGFSNLILAFLINKQTAHSYLERGYKPIGDGWNLAAPKWGIATPPTA
jgi:hypothetical protein